MNQCSKSALTILCPLDIHPTFISLECPTGLYNLHTPGISERGNIKENPPSKHHILAVIPLLCFHFWQLYSINRRGNIIRESIEWDLFKCVLNTGIQLTILLIQETTASAANDYGSRRYLSRQLQCWLFQSDQHCENLWLAGFYDVETVPSRLFTQPFIRAQIKVNIKAPRHWPLCGKFTGDR